MDVELRLGVLGQRARDERTELAGLGPCLAPSGKPIPSSAMMTLQPSPLEMLCSVIVPPSRPWKACLSAFVSNSFTTSPVGMATLIDTG